MTFPYFQPGAMLNTQAFGNIAENVEVPHIDTRAPLTTDFRYPIGKRWIYQGNGEWVLVQISSLSGFLSAVWIPQASTIQQINFNVPNGTSPVVSTSLGLLNLTSNDSSVKITGGLNTIDFSSYTTGTFVPTITTRQTSKPTITYVNQQGVWTRIGNICYVTIDISLSSFTDGTPPAAPVQLSTLPFLPSSLNPTHGVKGAGEVFNISPPANFNGVVSRVSASTTHIVLSQLISGQFGGVLATNALTNTSVLNASIIYFI